MMSELDSGPLLAWMRARQAIYRRRASGSPAPWSDDKIFQANRFCNVFRELDRVTVWVRSNWREPYADHPNLPFALALARSVNRPETLAELGFPRRWDKQRFLKVMDARRERGDALVTSAHLVYAGHGIGGVAQRIALTLDELAGLGACKRWVAPTLRETFERLVPLYGMGRFTAYEVVTDIRHTRWLRDADDIMTWCNIGQGSQRGLNRVTGRKLTARVPEAQAVAEVRGLLAIARRELAGDDPMFKALEMRDIEHSLCELDKYQRVAAGGSMKEKFKPRGDLP